MPHQAAEQAMTSPWLLSETQMRRIAPLFPLAHGVPRVDDRRVVSGIIFVLRHNLRWKDAPAAYGPHKTLYNRFMRWSQMGVFNLILAELAARPGGRFTVTAAHLQAHTTGALLHAQGLFADVP